MDAEFSLCLLTLRHHQNTRRGVQGKMEDEALEFRRESRPGGKAWGVTCREVRVEDMGIGGHLR